MTPTAITSKSSFARPGPTRPTTDLKDHRSVIHPDTVEKILSLHGVTFSFEFGIGNGINVSDQTFIDLGLKAISRDECLSQGNLIITPSALTLEESTKVKPGSSVLGMVNPFYAADELKADKSLVLTAVQDTDMPLLGG